MSKHTQSFTRDDGETEIEVDYTISGGCIAHMGSLNYPGHPAEDPEVEIIKAHDADGKEVQLTDAEDLRMCQWIIENHEDDEPDYEDRY